MRGLPKDGQKKPTIEFIYDGICHLGEGPVWNKADQRLYWTDIFNKRIWVYDPAQNKSRIFWNGDFMVGVPQKFFPWDAP